MNRFEPPPLPGGYSPSGPDNPYASPTASGQVDGTQTYPSQGHGVQGYGAAPQAPWGPAASYAHPRGTTVLVLGILSVVVASPLGPFAWFMGRKALREVDAAPHATSNRSSLQAGMVLGIIGTVLMVLSVFAVLALLGLLTVASVSSG